MQIRDLIPWGRSSAAAPASPEGGERAVSTLQQDINRMFDEFWSRVERPFGSGAGWLAPFGPRTDVAETDAAVEVSVELPGMDEKAIDVSLSGNTLTIRGEKKSEHEEKRPGFYMAERSYGAFHRAIPLPPGVDPDKAEAEFKRGVLHVRLPKTPESRASVKRIEVRGG